MGESADSLMRRGLISEKQAKKHGIKGTKVQPSKMADFNEKSGARDQGGIRDRGASDAATDHIDKNQAAGSSASPKPSKGGSVNKGGQPTRNAINEDQGPDFPAGKGKPGKKVGVKGPPAKSSGPQYGGPSSRGKTV